MRTLLIAGSFLAVPCLAQHCGYDFSSIIVVCPHAEGDSAVIGGLRITLLDSMNLPVTHHGHPIHLFHRNDPPPFRGYVRQRGEYRPYFPFAEDCYVLVIPNGFRTETMRILVQDDDPGRYVDKRHERWQDGYAQQVIPLTAFDNYLLCGRYNDATYPQLEGRPQYHPVDITLKRR